MSCHQGVVLLHENELILEEEVNILEALKNACDSQLSRSGVERRNIDEQVWCDGPATVVAKSFKWCLTRSTFHYCFLRANGLHQYANRSNEPKSGVQVKEPRIVSPKNTLRSVAIANERLVSVVAEEPKATDWGATLLRLNW